MTTTNGAIPAERLRHALDVRGLALETRLPHGIKAELAREWGVSRQAVADTIRRARRQAGVDGQVESQMPLPSSLSPADQQAAAEIAAIGQGPDDWRKRSFAERTAILREAVAMLTAWGREEGETP